MIVDRTDRIIAASEAIREVLERRSYLLEDGTMGSIHTGWTGPISWDLAEVAIDSLGDGGA